MLFCPTITNYPFLGTNEPNLFRVLKIKSGNENLLIQFSTRNIFLFFVQIKQKSKFLFKKQFILLPNHLDFV